MIKVTVRKKKPKVNSTEMVSFMDWELFMRATFTQEQFEQSDSRYFVSKHFPTQNILRL